MAKNIWRNLAPKKTGPLELVLTIVFRSYRVYGARAILGDLASFYLVTFFFGAMLAIGLNWRLLILLPLVLLSSLGIGELSTFRRTFRILGELGALKRSNPHFRFTNFTTAEYLETLYGASVTSEFSLDEGSEKDFAKLHLTPSEFFLGDYLRFVLVDVDPSAGAPLPGLRTFALPHRAWIFLNERPNHMDTFKNFNLLHEIGHTDPIITGPDIISEGHFLRFFISFAVIAVLVRWDLTSLGLLAVFLLLLLSVTNFTMKRVRPNLRYLEELYADVFAIRRCPKRWFIDFSDQHIKSFAKTVSDMSSEDTSQDTSFARHTIVFTKEQRELRQRNLVCEIKQLLHRDTNAATIPAQSPPWLGVVHIFQNIALIALLLTLGVRSAPLTTIRFISVIAITVGIICVRLMYEHMIMVVIDLWDGHANILSDELSAERRKNVDSFNRGMAMRKAWDDQRSKGTEDQARRAKVIAVDEPPMRK